MSFAVPHRKKPAPAAGRTESSSKIVYAEHMLQALVRQHAPWYSEKEVKAIFYRNLAKDRLNQPRLVDRLQDTAGSQHHASAIDTMLGLNDQLPDVTYNTMHAAPSALPHHAKDLSRSNSRSEHRPRSANVDSLAARNQDFVLKPDGVAPLVRSTAPPQVRTERIHDHYHTKDDASKSHSNRYESPAYASSVKSDSSATPSTSASPDRAQQQRSSGSRGGSERGVGDDSAATDGARKGKVVRRRSSLVTTVPQPDKAQSHVPAQTKPALSSPLYKNVSASKSVEDLTVTSEDTQVFIV
ncbi:hypothetical protein PTSG_00347 [Salpingoeca rosetta]|uniref:Uncharacterized protein n=1 Tax=Salpingoeca rosetta (strain ATCC 50818 / BSB-021) TaxID=946362 RepID=F2TW82_SALR5|nr:uncharacterized protein PTSG_00347 [Salpingoeca rosetta]EGD72328.1 hypothetical protein PTSG_00347 [Salpingoeca rosetta]|eukprot:XP_004998898.1 hypothetical protein PTSG_00347 [Salpingoeca rosetta]